MEKALSGPLQMPSLLKRHKPAKRNSIIPGFGMTMGITLIWLSLVVLIPLSTVFIKAAGMGVQDFVAVGFSDRAMAAYKVSFGTALIAAIINAVFGIIIAWVFVRYQFPGKRVLDALIDLPFALPTAVAGIALTAIYAGNGWVGQFLEPLGIGPGGRRGIGWGVGRFGEPEQRHLAPAVVGHADHRHLSHSGVGGEGVLDLYGRDVLAT